MISKNLLVKFVICSIVATLVIGLGAVEAADPTRGVTANTIRIGMLPDLSGPYKAAGPGMRKGAEAWFKHINDKGGIHGRKIELIVEDDGGSPSTAISAANKLIYNDKVFAIAGVHGSSAFEAIFDLVGKEKVPSFSLGYSTSNYVPLKKMIFLIGSPYYYQAARAVTHIAEELKIKNPKLAVLYQDDVFGRDFLDGIRDEAKAQGITILKEETFARGSQDLSSQVASLKRAGAEQVILGGVYIHAGLFMREAKKIGYDPLVIGPNPSKVEVFFDIAKESGKGLKVVDCYGQPGEKSLAEVEAITMKYSGIPPQMVVLMGLTIAQAITAGLEKTGKNLTIDNFVNAMESLKNVDMKGTMAPLTLGPKRHFATAANRVFEVDVAHRTWNVVAPMVTPKIAR